MSSKPLYYVEYLGWKEAQGLYGREFTESIVSKLLIRRRHHQLPRLTLELNKKELNISQETPSRHGGKSAEKVKYPPIPSKDITYVSQSTHPDADVVSCIFLGYNPNTRRAVHVHAYRFDQAETAARFVAHVRKIIESRKYRERIVGIEKDLAERGNIVMRRNDPTPVRGKGEPTPDYGGTNGGGAFYANDNNSDGQSWETSSLDAHMDPVAMSPRNSRGPVYQPSQQSQTRYPPAADALKARSDIRIERKPRVSEEPKSQKRLFNNLQEELDYKLSLKEPILLPPKDYDTILRKHGQIETRDQRRSQNARVVGPNSIFAVGGVTNGVGVNGTTSEEGGSASGLSPQSSLSGGVGDGVDETHSITSSETEHTGGAASSDASGSIGMAGGHINGWSSPRGPPKQAAVLLRSTSEVPGNGMHAPLGRQSSRTSDPSINSEDYSYADGLYYGMSRRNGRSRHAPVNNNNNKETEPSNGEMVMWSDNFSFASQDRRGSGQRSHGSRNGSFPSEEDVLARTAPAGQMFRHSVPANGSEVRMVTGGGPFHGSHLRRTSEQHR